MGSIADRAIDQWRDQPRDVARTPRLFSAAANSSTRSLWGSISHSRATRRQKAPRPPLGELTASPLLGISLPHSTSTVMARAKRG
jgi:hypothetical protein